MCDCCKKIIVQTEINSGSTVYYNKINFQPDINEPGGYPLIGGAALTIPVNSTSSIADLQTSNIEIGNYMLFFEGVIDGGGSTALVNFNYEIRLNNVVIPYSTRIFRVTSGTPSDYTSTISVNIPVTITNTNDILTVWVYNHSVNKTVVIIGASLTALKL